MTTTPDAITPAPAAPVPAAADRELADMCQTAGDHLAGLIAQGMLHTVGRPDRLPELLWPDADPELVRAIWERALPVGVVVGKSLARPRWTPEGFDRLRTALREAGYQGMARHADRTARLHHPADHEHGTTRPRDNQ
ncbi:hypothetical protein AB0D12_31500 [Streptomyces sp. NPDC048479]|uniref:hypothetical protein n=1 Tax=Streptomyces sp. NPDC048479 TaxID=3154725 RepID=UPI00342E9CC1